MSFFLKNYLPPFLLHSVWKHIAQLLLQKGIHIILFVFLTHSTSNPAPIFSFSTKMNNISLLCAREINTISTEKLVLIYDKLLLLPLIKFT